MVLSGFTIPRVFSRLLCAIALVTSSPLVSAQSSSVSLAGTLPEDYLPELKEILATALQRSPEVIARDFARLVQEARVIQADSPRYPQVGGNFNYGITQTATATNINSKSKDDGFFYNFGFNQAIFHWYALRNQSLSARITLLVAQKEFAIAYREFSVLLRKMYLGLIVEQARLNHLRGVLQLARDDVSVAAAKRDMGTLSSADVEG
jgi:outer membrane protein TolC